MSDPTEHAPRPVVVLDKSFAQGARNEALQLVAESSTIVVTSGFYFECFTTLSESRRRVFAGFPEFRRVHTPRLFRLEEETGQPADSLNAVRLEVNPDLISESRHLSPDEQRCLDDYEREVVRPEIAFWRDVMIHGVVGFDVSDIDQVRGNQPAFESLCERLHDLDFMRRVAAEINTPNAESIDENWFTFRLLQAKLLHGLTLRYTYPQENTARSDTDLEHDVHDIEYLSVGLHARSFATNESAVDFRKLGWKFKFLCPEGLLHQSQHANLRSQQP